MKKVGLKHPVYALYDDSTGSPVYTSGALMGKAIQANITWNKNNVALYADDSIDENDQSITGGTETLGLNELTHTVQAVILGHEINGDGELVVNDQDIAPYVGHGFYGRTIQAGVSKFRAVWLKKVQFGEPNDETNTKAETIAFQTPSLEATIMRDINGDLKEEKVFETEAAAIAWLDTKAAVSYQVVKPVASIASGTYSGTQSVTLTCATAGASIYYTTNGTTPSATNGTLYSVAISVAASAALRAIAIKSGMNNSEIATYEYIITA